MKPFKNIYYRENLGIDQSPQPIVELCKMITYTIPKKFSHLS